MRAIVWLLVLVMGAGCSDATGNTITDSCSSRGGPDGGMCLSPGVACNNTCHCCAGFICAPDPSTLRCCRPFVGDTCNGDYDCCGAMLCRNGRCANPSGTTGTTCNCSSVRRDCTISYDSAGRATRRCTCAPSCCPCS